MESLFFIIAFILFIVFYKQILTIFAILTGDKATLHDAGSLCHKLIPDNDQFMTPEEMSLLPVSKEVKKWTQLQDGSWVPVKANKPQ
jgi:hypothetical protein